jgi:ankyrin repeat protein
MAKLPPFAYEALTNTYNNPLGTDTINTLPEKLGIMASDDRAAIKRKVNAVKGATQETPLHIISAYGSRSTSDSSTADAGPNYLFQNGANPNALDWKGKTPLHWAASKGNEHMFNWLLNHDANVDVKDKKGVTIDQGDQFVI